MIQNAFRLSWSLAILWCCTMVWGQCEADHNVIVTNFEFTPSSLTVVPGETVAFINIEGLHGVNGDSSTVTGASFGNPEVFALDQAEGAIEGTCLGVVTFDIPGVYQYDCPVGYNAEAGMQAEIVVDAFDLADLLFQTSQAGVEPTFWQSGYAFESFVPEVLTSLTPHTLFAPSDQAVSDVMDFMNLGQFDMLNIPDFTEIMQYHAVPGVFMAEDLEDGMALQTLQGQTLPVVVNGQGTFVDGAQVIAGDYVADNGVVHVLDSVLAPQGLPTQHVMGWIEESEEHGILWLAIQQLGPCPRFAVWLDVRGGSGGWRGGCHARDGARLVSRGGLGGVHALHRQHVWQGGCAFFGFAFAHAGGGVDGAPRVHLGSGAFLAVGHPCASSRYRDALADACDVQS